MRRALNDLGMDAQRGRPAPSPSARPAASTPLAAGQQNARAQSNAQHGGIGPRRNRFAASADVPVVHLPLGRGVGRTGRPAGPDPLAGLGELAAAPEAAPRAPDDHALREVQDRLDRLQAHLHNTQLKLDEALAALQARDTEIAVLQARLEAPPDPQPIPEPPPAPAQPAQSARTARLSRDTPRAEKVARVKPGREPKPVRWWIKPKG